MSKKNKKWIDIGNGLTINADLVDYYDETNHLVVLINGEKYHYGEFPPLNGIYREECYDSNKGDFAYFKAKER